MRTKSAVNCFIVSLINFTAVLFITSACGRMPSHPGYILLEKRFVKELNADCYLLEHEKSGARVLKVAADDPNKTFSIAFHTIPETDAGIPHIMEHSVLNGSKHFPVKSPFDVLYKGSLNTFLNAMTYTDFTVYPVASMNHADYFNLMHVYLDAVFNPLIYDDPRIFMQEGWHYELTAPEDPLTYKGVVYNEMKGAFSSSTRELWYQIQKGLFPDNAYGNSSGGYPAAIPSLTYQSFLSYHEKYYHPSNSLIFLYGDADLAEELAFIDKEYLSGYDKKDLKTTVPRHKAFDAVREASAYYPVIEGDPVKDQTYLAMSWVIGDGGDTELVMALDVLSDVLFNQESAPVRLALQEAGVGKDVSAYADNLQQNMFTVVVQNANPEDKDLFRKTVTETLQKVCDGGLDNEAVEGSLNRMEFRLREGDDANTGVTQSIRAIRGWLYAGDPFVTLTYEKPLSKLKASIGGAYFTDIIREQILANTDGLVLTLSPKPGLEKQNMERTSEALAAKKAAFTATEIDSVLNTTRELISYQQREDSPEALATIPMLALDDVDREVAWYEAGQDSIEGVSQYVYHDFTNDIVYTTLWFDMRTLPQEMIPHAALLAELLGKLDTDTMAYGDLDKALQINTGGFGASTVSMVPYYEDQQMIPLFQVRMKTTRDKLDKSMQLLADILTGSRFDNRDRLKDLLERHQSQLEMDVSNNGYNVAMRRFGSYLSERGKFTELTAGVSYYWFMTDLLESFDADPDQVIRSLETVSASLFTRDNMKAGVVCEADDYNAYASSFRTFAGKLRNAQIEPLQWVLTPEPENEGFTTASKVQYVIQGYNFRSLGLEWDGKWNVLSQILTTDWLQTQIRVIGGAYGGFSGFSRYGTVYLASYRDPNLRETFGNYEKTAGYLNGFNADSSAMSRFIIGTVASLDQPLTASQKGDLAFRRQFEHFTRDQLQKERNEVLSTTAEDIRNMSGIVSDILQKEVYCVYGNEDKVKENEDLFKTLTRLQK